MKAEDINCLKKYLSKGKSLKVCILDNNSVDFLTRVHASISPEQIFSQYDMIFVPQWVWVEVCDSESRKDYIKDLGHRYIVQILDEVDYSILVNYKEAELYYLFYYCCYNVSRLVSFIRKNVLKNRPVEDLEPYGVWLKKIYEEGLENKKLSNGRIRRKNAGEILISVLCYILSYYYSENIDTITIFSNDRDSYEFVNKARELFYKDVQFKNRRNTSITFKSNDFLIYEWIRHEYINEDNIGAFVENNRQMRRIKFTRKKQDNSIEEQDEVIENAIFLGMLKDSTIHIIF